MTRTMRRPAYDSEEIRDALTVADVLESAGIPVDGDRIACPIHGGEDVTAFAIYDEGRRYWCHTECGKGGDVFTLIRALAEKRSVKVDFRKALEIAARVRPSRTFFTHIAHGLAHAETNRSLPPTFQLAHDGLRVTATL